MVNCSGLRMSYGARVLFDGADFLVKDGEKIGLVGPNGAGKTTVFRLIAGIEHPDAGGVAVDPSQVVGYFSQDVGELSGRSVLEEAMSGARRVYDIGLRLAELEARMADPGLSDAEMDRYGELQTEYMERGGYELEQRAREVLTGLGIAPGRQGEAVERFSGGWKMRVALAKILLLQPDVLLMDEPTNHLDLESIVWLESWLADFPGALVMTSHDREFMTRICRRTVEVAFGDIVSYSGDYDFYLREREIRRAQLVASQKRQQAMLAKEEEFIARFAARASHAAQVQSRVKAIEKIERIEIPQDPKTIRLEFKPAKRSGDIVASLAGLAKRWPREGGGELTVFEGVDATVVRGQKVALAGVNGAGKSTLLKVVAGLTPPSAGSATLGASVAMGYFSQYSSDQLDPARTIFEELSERLPNESIAYIRNLLGAFQFGGDDVDKKISVLSGGEKSRVVLAGLLAQPLNFLILDEPTNHLDIASRQVLLQALSDFDGTILIVSHDRYFLKHLANRVFAVGDGRLRTYEGDYQYYLDKTAGA